MTTTFVNGDTLVFVGEAFTANLTTVISGVVGVTTATERIIVVGWSLTVTANSAAATCAIKDSGSGVYASHVFSVPGTNPVPAWVVEAANGGHGIRLPADAELVIGPGGANGVLDGVVWLRKIPA